MTSQPHSDAEIRELLRNLRKPDKLDLAYPITATEDDLVALIEEQTRLARKEGWIDGYHTGCDKSVESRHQKHNQRCKKEGK